MKNFGDRKKTVFKYLILYELSDVYEKSYFYRYMVIKYIYPE